MREHESGGDFKRSIWRTSGTKNRSITVPVFLAYCVLGAALRGLVRRGGSARALLVVETSDAAEVFAQAGRLFLRQHFHFEEYEKPTVWVLSESRKGNRVRRNLFEEAAEKDEAILICDSETEFDEEAALWADVFVHLPKPTTRQIEATFRRFGYVLNDSDLEMLEAETWTRLSYAFPPKRPVSVGLQRLRSGPHAVVKEVGQPDDGPTLADLHGFGAAAEWGFELARDLEDFRAGRVRWDEVDAGVLISGRPGTGKTLFAGALARSCQVPIIASSAAQWQAAGYLNDFLRSMHATFEEARAQAPCLLFIDEIDAFGNRTTGGHNDDYKRQAINGLLEELDGFKRRSGVVVVGATNHPEDLDPAIKRAGRLDRHIVIPLPDATTRQKIFEQLAGFAVPPEQMDRFGRSTEGMSGAEIEQLVRDGKRVARRRGSRDARFDDVVHLMKPLVRLPSLQRRVVSVHETGHAVVGFELGMNLESVEVNETFVEDGATSVGVTHFRAPEFARHTRSFYNDHLAMLLAGLAAEKMIFGDFCDGAVGGDQSDLARATALATKMEACFGLGRTLAVEVVSNRELALLRAQDPSLRECVQHILEQAFERATSILRGLRSAVDEIATCLEERRFLSAHVIESIIDENARGPTGREMTQGEGRVHTSD
ncbi:AAA family ATPase [Shinella zoogloeoides]|uniref:AAA family ATPase n=1 Tax=Shinella zoogloeoides TaxID=352475 RepID=UPI001F5A269D|nr:AAA family ATPase [Shinella zoogloeoides]